MGRRETWGMAVAPKRIQGATAATVRIRNAWGAHRARWAMLDSPLARVIKVV